MPNLPQGLYQASDLNLHHHTKLPQAQGLSLAIHASLILILLIPALAPFDLKPPTPRVRIFFAGLPAPADANHRSKPSQGGGGSGNQQPEPAGAGKFAQMNWIQLTPPRLNPGPSPLQVQPSIVGPPDAPLPNLRFLEIGDPFGVNPSDSQGPGRGGSFGKGKGKGQGDGEGDGGGPGEKWGTGGGQPRIGGSRDASMPVCAYCPNPTFTEEAIKVRVQGFVTLRLVVTEHGKPTNISIVRTVGYGLDERAIAAVKDWRFHPARDRQGRGVPVWVTVEVSFRQF